MSLQLKKEVQEYPNNTIDLQPTVSVSIVTYNHAAYIKQCLDGILMQQTNFDFEILLGEDASTDGTREICIKYADKHPSKIRLFLHHRENNIKIGGNPTGRFNFLFNLSKARGKYIAICEGDDYWTDPFKLQKQVDVMGKNSTISLSTTDLKVLNSDGITSEYYKPNRPRPKEINNCSDFFGDDRLGPFHTSTLLLRKDVVITCLSTSAFSTLPYADWIMVYTAAKMGSIHFLNDKTSIYRHHPTSLMRSQSSIRNYLNMIDLDTFLSTHLPAPYGNMKFKGTYWYHDQLSYLFAAEGKYGKTISHFFRGLMIKPVRTPFKSYISHLRNLGYYWKKGLTS